MTLRACCPMENELLVSQWRLSATLPFPLACPRPPPPRSPPLPPPPPPPPLFVCRSVALSAGALGFCPAHHPSRRPQASASCPRKVKEAKRHPSPLPPAAPRRPPPPSPLPFRLALRIARGKDSDQKARRMALVTMLAQDHCSSDILSSMLLSVFAHALQGLLQVHRRHDHGLP